MNPTRHTRITLRRGLALVAPALGGLALSAQTPQDPAPAAGEPGKIVELSPFLVDAGKDNGYAALETTSGTRMRSSLRDLAAPLSVITAELLQDLAATSPVEALLFTPSVDTVDGGPQGGPCASATASPWPSADS